MNNNFLSSPKKIYPSQLVLTSMRIENEIRPLFTPNDIKMEILLTKNNTKYECPICLGPGKNLCYQVSANIYFVLNVLINGRGTLRNVLYAELKSTNLFNFQIIFDK